MSKFWNIPNILTLFRLALIPVFVLVFLFIEDEHHYFSLAIFLIACFTDVLDGIIARRTNTITNYGVVMDPLADKLLKIATLICFTLTQVVPLWLTITLVSIDLSMIFAGVCLYSQKITIPSNWIGKTGTVVMSIGFVLCFFHTALNNWNLYVLYGGMIIIILSIIVYTIKNFRRVLDVILLKNRKRKVKLDNKE
ncbi:MAG: CDP-alcohol phosphatidyltransferase family protein [Clostridia bacterium]|nr:CDP-alcohol phosphatidyltransferase family protein [Clostridia bacterium]